MFDDIVYQANPSTNPPCSSLAFINNQHAYFPEVKGSRVGGVGEEKSEEKMRYSKIPSFFLILNYDCSSSLMLILFSQINVDRVFLFLS